MDKQKQIEEMAKVMCGGCHNGKECMRCLCADWYRAEMLYDAGYRKIPEGSVVTEEEYEQLCKDKNDYKQRYDSASKQYEQLVQSDCEALEICTTTKGRAEKERDYLNQEYDKGWEVEKVEPIVFKDNREDIEKRMEEYENEIKNAQKQAIKEFAKRLKMQFEDSGVFYPTSTIEKKIKATEKQMGVEL